jgi:hypothetical protein
MFKRCGALAGLLLATTVLAVPASASASEWTMGGEVLEESATVEFSGMIAMGTAIDSITCGVTIKFTLAPKGQASTVDAITVPKPGGCTTRGNFGLCNVKSGQGVNLNNAAVVPKGKFFEFTNVTIRYTWLLSCPKPWDDFTYASIVATPSDPKHMKSVTLSGTGEDESGEVMILEEVEEEQTNVLEEIGESEEGTYGMTE